MQQLLHRGAAVTQHRTDEMLDASWDDLKSFLACARYKSFRNAADVLGLTSTTLMRRIDRLEERIGCKLFLRDQSGLTLSEDGAAMIGDVMEMERQAFNVFRRASHSSSDTRGTVRVAVTEGPGNFWILPRLIDFQKTYRKITVDLRCAMEQADVARLEADIAIQLEPPDQSRPDRHQARPAAYLRLRLGGLSQAAWRAVACRPQKPPAGHPARAAGRRFRLCPGAGT